MNSKYFLRTVLIVLIIYLFGNYIKSFCQEKTLIFPIPLKVQLGNGNFVIDKSTTVIVPQKENQADKLVASLLKNEIVDRYNTPLKISSESTLTKNGKFILIGTLENPLVKHFCDQNELTSELKDLGTEGYILFV